MDEKKVKELMGEKYAYPQNYDVVLLKRRPPLFFEEGICEVYYNLSAETYGTTLDSVKTDKPVIVFYLKRNVQFFTSRIYSARYLEKEDCLMLYCLELVYSRKGKAYSGRIIEKGRTIILNNCSVIRKDGPIHYCSQGETISKKKFLELKKDVQHYKKNTASTRLYTELYRKVLGVESRGYIGDEERYLSFCQNGQMISLEDTLAKSFMPCAYVETGNEYIVVDSFKKIFDYCTFIGNGGGAVKKDGKTQEMCDELCRIVDEKLPTLTPYSDDSDRDIYRNAVIQRVSYEKPMAIVRLFLSIKGREKVFECSRIFISEKRLFFVKKNNYGEYISSVLPTKANHWDFNVVGEIEQSVLDGTLAQYFTKVLQEADSEEVLIYLWMFSKYPMLESLAKVAGSEIVTSIIDYMKNVDVPLKTALLAVLGVEEVDENKLFDAIGINGKQLNILKPLLDCYPASYGYNEKSHKKTEVARICYGLIPFLKNLYDRTDMRNIGLEEFKEVAEFFADFLGRKYAIYKNSYHMNGGFIEDEKSVIQALRRAKEVFGEDFKFKKLFPCLNNVLEGIEANPTYNNTICHRMNTLNDGINMAFTAMSVKEELGIERRHIIPNIKTLEELVIWHDNMVTLTNSINGCYDEIIFKANYDCKWKPLEWGENRKEFPWIVVAPQKTRHVATEGTVLNHCVKNYIPRLVRGETNVVFIRLKDAPREPFFTVEVDNQKIIQQVHGFGNRNMSTEPNLDKFVSAWARAKHLKVGKIDHLRG